MSFAEAPSPLFNNTPDATLSLVKLYRVLIIIIPIIWFLLFICICCLCYYTIKKINNSVQEDIEQGLSSSSPAPQQLRLVIVNMPEDKKDQEAVSFKKVSWADFKEAIKNNKSHYEDVMSSSNIHECVICYEEFVDGDECRVRSKCNHIFHQNCISGWLSTHTTCPLCRGGVPGYVYRYVSINVGDQNPAIRV